MVWVAALTGRDDSSSRFVLDAFIDGRITVVTCGWLVNETIETLVGIEVPVDKVEKFIALFSESEHVEIVTIDHQEMGSPDPTDNALFETAVVGGAEHIVTRETKLLKKLKPAVRAYYAQRGIAVTHHQDFPGILRARERETPQAKKARVTERRLRPDGLTMFYRLPKPVRITAIGLTHAP